MNIKMKLRTVIFLIVLFPVYSFSQDEWENWDKDYKIINVDELLNYEIKYADSTDKGLIEGNYYLRMDTYRFSASYLGEKRRINDTILASMKRVFKMRGNPDYLSTFDDIKHEYKFKIGDIDLWLPIQPVLEKPLRKEIQVGEMVLLYCLFLNEHGMSGDLYNTFFISEFRKE